MAPNSRKPAPKNKRKFENKRYFIVPRGLGDATCKTCGESVTRPNYGATSMHYHLSSRHPRLWEEAVRNADAAGKEEKKAKGGVKKPLKEKPRRRIVIEDSEEEDEPSTSAAVAPPPVEDPQTGRRGTMEGEWPVERVEAMRIAQNGEVFWWIKWRGFPDEQSTWEPWKPSGKRPRNWGVPTRWDQLLLNALGSNWREIAKNRSTYRQQCALHLEQNVAPPPPVPD